MNNKAVYIILILVIVVVLFSSFSAGPAKESEEKEVYNGDSASVDGSNCITPPAKYSLKYDEGNDSKRWGNIHRVLGEWEDFPVDTFLKLEKKKEEGTLKAVERIKYFKLSAQRNKLKEQVPDVEGWFKSADIYPSQSAVNYFRGEIQKWIDNGGGKSWNMVKGSIRCQTPITLA